MKHIIMHARKITVSGRNNIELFTLKIACRTIYNCMR